MNIKHQTQPYPEEEILDNLHPFVREWFTSKFAQCSPPQRFSIRNIQLGINTLISSPTGTGKTLSAFLAVLNDLVTRSDLGTLHEGVHCIYISPLKALANDIARNLLSPLEEISAIAERNGRTLNISVLIRTGDTTTNEKNKMRTKPPHILITTPESFAIALTSTKFSEHLASVRYLIIDEIHALAEGKRGTHLVVSAERLAQRATFTRIGLSATVAPLEEVGTFLVGYENPEKKETRHCNIIDVDTIIRSGNPEFAGFQKHADLTVLSPVPDLLDTTYQDMQNALYRTIHDLVQEHKTTLIFTNTRSATERVVHQLKDRYPKFYSSVLDADEEQEKIEETDGENSKEKNKEHNEEPIKREPTPESRIGAHHGSLSKEHRLQIESMLKKGALRCVVCSTSLELGIDIGAIDLVILLGSPKSVARALQRIGRSGHSLYTHPKGRIIVLDRDDLVECSILLRSALQRKIDRVSIPKNALDVLAQQFYGMAIERTMAIEEAWWVVRKAMPYVSLPRKDFENILTYLAGESIALEQRNVYGKIWLDREQGNFGKKGKLARLIYMTNIGTIPDETSVRVKIGEHTIGTITEEFMEMLKPGDVFVLGGEPYEFKFSRGMTIQVKTSAGRLPTVPNWISESLPLNYDLALEIQAFRKHVSGLLEEKKPSEEILSWMRQYLRADENAIKAIFRYLQEQHRFSTIPHKYRILIEHFRDGNKKHVFIHTLYGRRVNEVLARAIGYINGKLTGRDVEVVVTDNGFALRSTQPIQATRAFSLLRSEDLQTLMELALERSEVLKRRFRHCATRGLMILRTYKGERKSVGKQQISSQLILSAVRGLGKEFPLLKEAHREVLEDLMDIGHAREVVEEIQKGSISIIEKNTDLPSPFAFHLVIQGYVDILKMEDRIEFVRRLHRLVLEEMEGKKSSKEERALPAMDFTYERLWEEQEAQKRLKEENYQEYLRQQLQDVSRKIGLDADISYHAQRLIAGDRGGYPEKFSTWIQTLLSGTIPKVWPDDLVKFFKEKEKEL